MTDKISDNDIVKALECEANEKVCIHEQYEEACGLWCKHLHKWCADMSGKNDKNNCSTFKSAEPNKRAKTILDFINRQRAEIERLQKAVEDKGGLILIETAKTEAYREFAERLKIRSHTIKTADGIVVECTPLDYIDRILKELVGEDDG